MKKYYPLFIVEIYLIFTLLIFFIGPVVFNYRNKIYFIVLMFFYHASFVAGYIYACRKKFISRTTSRENFSAKKFWTLFVTGIIGVVAAYNNLMLSETFIPYDFFENLNRGISEPGLVYAERMSNMEQGLNSGSRLFNIFSIFFSFAKLLFIFYFIFFWGEMKLTHKISCAFYCFMFLSSGVSAGVNSVVFIFVIFTLISLFIVLYVKKSKYFKVLIFISTVVLLIPILSFGNIMSQRGGGFEYFISTSPLGDISLKTSFELDDNSSLIDFLYYSLVWLSYYLVQGYYGFSLIIDLDWNWTFGFGNSEFFQRQFSLVTGFDVSNLTYQHRISHLWDKSAQWHSFYGQFANDFGIYGLIIMMAALGYHFSMAFQSAIIQKSFYAAALMPIFTIMFIFFPANNQIFAFIDMISYFIFVNIFWFLEDKNIKV